MAAKNIVEGCSVVPESQSVFDGHKRRIAIQTLKLSDIGADIMGGMTKDEARNYLRRLGYSERQITRIEGGPEAPSGAATGE